MKDIACEQDAQIIAQEALCLTRHLANGKNSTRQEVGLEAWREFRKENGL